MKTLRPCLTITAALLVLCCLVYPAVVTASAQLMFKDRANGSLVVGDDGTVRGSSLIGQSVADWGAHPEYFWGRPSGASNDAATSITYSSGSNYGPGNPALADEVAARIALLRASGVAGPIPADLVTKSASGLDPELSPAAVEVQVARVAAARHVSPAEVRQMAQSHTLASTLGFIGEPRVNVLMLNLDLDAKAPLPRAAATSTAWSVPAH